jgi:hypothetical protein
MSVSDLKRVSCRFSISLRGFPAQIVQVYYSCTSNTRTLCTSSKMKLICKTSKVSCMDNTISTFTFCLSLSPRRRRAYLLEKAVNTKLVPRTPPPQEGGEGEGDVAESAGRCFSHSGLRWGLPTFTAAPQTPLSKHCNTSESRKRLFTNKPRKFGDPFASPIQWQLFLHRSRRRELDVGDLY